MATLFLSLKSEYFDAIKDGTKTEEYREVTEYWSKRIVGRKYDEIVLTKGYPRADDMTRRIYKPWRGYTLKTITHPHFGNRTIQVFAIDVSG